MPILVEIDKILAELLTVKVFSKMADTVCWFHALSGFLAETRLNFECQKLLEVSTV